MKHFFKNTKNTSVLVDSNVLYYTSLHIKLSSVFYSTQLVDMLSYELPISKNENKLNSRKLASLTTSVLVYNFHSIFFQQRFFIFVTQSFNFINKKKTKNLFFVNSIAELFPNANWLEREVSELHGLVFFGKKDLRNLLLQYGDTTAPMLKAFPSIGTREIFYDSVSDLLVQSPTTIQF